MKRPSSCPLRKVHFAAVSVGQAVIQLLEREISRKSGWGGISSRSSPHKHVPQRQQPLVWAEQVEMKQPGFTAPHANGMIQPRGSVMERKIPHMGQELQLGPKLCLCYTANLGVCIEMSGKKKTEELEH